MNEIQQLLSALDERTIAAKVSNKHDEARLRYVLDRNTVSSFEEFENVIADYYDYHFNVETHGGYLEKGECRSRAKEALEKHYQRERGDIQTAYLNAKEGTNGGLRIILDIIADNFKERSQIHYVTDMFDQFVKPNDFEQKTKIIAQFLEMVRPTMGDSIDASSPERYANNYKEVIQAYVDGLRSAHRPIRRL